MSQRRCVDRSRTDMRLGVIVRRLSSAMFSVTRLMGVATCHSLATHDSKWNGNESSNKQNSSMPCICEERKIKTGSQEMNKNYDATTASSIDARNQTKSFHFTCLAPQTTPRATSSASPSPSSTSSPCSSQPLFPRHPP